MTDTAPPATNDRPAPWAVGQRPNLRIRDHALSADLELLATRHGTVTDAIRAAVRQAAAALREPADPTRDALAALADDPDVIEALTVLTRTLKPGPDGAPEPWTATDAVRSALGTLADIHDAAWTRGIYPDGHLPDLDSWTYRPYAAPADTDTAQDA